MSDITKKEEDDVATGQPSAAIPSVESKQPFHVGLSGIDHPWMSGGDRSTLPYATRQVIEAAVRNRRGKK